MALYMTIVMGGTPIGSPIIGWVGQHFGPRWTLVGGGLLTIVGVLLALALFARPSRAAAEAAAAAEPESDGRPGRVIPGRLGAAVGLQFSSGLGLASKLASRSLRPVHRDFVASDRPRSISFWPAGATRVALRTVSGSSGPLRTPSFRPQAPGPRAVTTAHEQQRSIIVPGKAPGLR